MSSPSLGMQDCRNSTWPAFHATALRSLRLRRLPSSSAVCRRPQPHHLLLPVTVTLRAIAPRMSCDACRLTLDRLRRKHRPPGFCIDRCEFWAQLATSHHFPLPVRSTACHCPPQCQGPCMAMWRPGPPHRGVEKHGGWRARRGNIIIFQKLRNAFLKFFFFKVFLLIIL